MLRVYAIPNAFPCVVQDLSPPEEEFLIEFLCEFVVLVRSSIAYSP